MPRFDDATPQVSVRLYKTISRETLDGDQPVSNRYQGKDEYIDLTPFLGHGSAVTTSKSVREPAGAFSITFADRPHQSVYLESDTIPTQALESIYGLVEPMDMVEIRMWGGIGRRPAELPIKMRGFVSTVQRAKAMGDDGKPVRQIIVAGQDYGKIWQMYQVLYLPAYVEGEPLLTAFQFSELFGVDAANVLPAAELVRRVVSQVINPHINGFMPEHSPLPRAIDTGSGITVPHGMVNQSYQTEQGSVYSILSNYGDVGIWNELYIEDRQDGVYCIYRPTPALPVVPEKEGPPEPIQPGAPKPTDVAILDNWVQSVSSQRGDERVANFYWVNGARLDLVTDMSRRLAGVSSNEPTINLRSYANTRADLYGTRPMYGDTMQAGDDVTNFTTGLSPSGQEQRDVQLEAWVEQRRRTMVEMNRDNVLLESGAMRVKGGIMRADGVEPMKAGDYAVVTEGTVTWRGYIVELHDEFSPFESYTANIQFERGTSFVERMVLGAGVNSPWLAEQARRVR